MKHLPLQITLAIRYLAGRKLRTFLTTLAIVFGVTLVFGMNLLLPTLIAAMQTNVQGAEGNVDFSITNVSGESFPLELVGRLQNVDGIRAISGSLQRTINLPKNFIDREPSKPDRVMALSLTGVIPEQARSLRAYPIIVGRYLLAGDGASAVISQTLADAYSVRVGGIIRVPSSNGVTGLEVVGILPPSLAPVTEQVLVNLPQAQLMMDDPGNINIIELNIEAFAGKERRLEIQRSIETSLGSNYRVGGPEAGDELFAAIELGRIGLNMFGVLALFMGGFIIFNTFRTVVSERRRDIGMLRAIGATRRAVLGIILAEGVIQGLVGSVVGLGLGYLMALGILQLAEIPMSQFINLKLGLPVLSVQLVTFSLLLGVGVTVFAGLLPAYYASRVTPLEALRPALAEAEFRSSTRCAFLTGLALVIITVLSIFSGNPALIIPGGFLFLLGLMLMIPGLVRPFANIFGRITSLIFTRDGIGDLAKSSLTRQATRVAVTVSASMLGLAVVVTAGGLVTSLTGTLGGLIRNSLGSDYLFVPPSIGIWSSNVGSNPVFAEKLRHTEGVQAVSTFRYAASHIDDQSISLIGIEPRDFQQVSGLNFIKGNESAYAELSQGRTLIANGPFLIVSGKKVNDEVDLLTINGPVRYRIVAAASDLLNAKITCAYISQENLAADFGSSDDVFIQLNLKKDANREASGALIKSLAADYPQFKLISGTDYFSTIQAQLDAAFLAIYILFIVLAFPSLIAMLNTLSISIIERTREIGMIRAVGATQKQVRAMVVTEALLLAAIGTAFGILGGLYLGYVLVTAIKVIYPMGYYFPQFGILAAIAIGLIFGVLAALIPAGQAARMNVVEALRYE